MVAVTNDIEPVDPTEEPLSRVKRIKENFMNLKIEIPAMSETLKAQRQRINDLLVDVDIAAQELQDRKDWLHEALTRTNHAIDGIDGNVAEKVMASGVSLAKQTPSV